jgi:hypothetical protein
MMIRSTLATTSSPLRPNRIEAGTATPQNLNPSHPWKWIEGVEASFLLIVVFRVEDQYNM